MPNTVQQFQTAEETRVVASKRKSRRTMETQKETESAEKLAEKEKQIAQNKERRVETAAAD